MSRAVLVNTGPLYAAVDPDDQFHSRSHEELSRLAADQIEVIICTPVLAEAYTLISRRLSLNAGHQWLADISQGAGLLNPDLGDYVQAMSRVKFFEDQPLTLVDSVLAILCERLDLPVWTYDHHFDVMRVERWL